MTSKLPKTSRSLPGFSNTNPWW